MNRTQKRAALVSGVAVAGLVAIAAPETTLEEMGRAADAGDVDTMRAIWPDRMAGCSSASRTST